MKSKVGFILALIGGIFSILGGIIILIDMIIQAWTISTFYSKMPEFGQIYNTQKIVPLINPDWLIAIGIFGLLWMTIMGILTIIGSIKMNKEDNKKVKNGGILALVVGILSFNIFTIIGGIFGIIDSKKEISN